jgi:hypothetical protein
MSLKRKRADVAVVVEPSPTKKRIKKKLNIIEQLTLLLQTHGDYTSRVLPSCYRQSDEEDCTWFRITKQPRACISDPSGQTTHTAIGACICINHDTNIAWFKCWSPGCRSKSKYLGSIDMSAEGELLEAAKIDLEELYSSRSLTLYPVDEQYMSTSPMLATTFMTLQQWTGKLISLKGGMGQGKTTAVMRIIQETLIHMKGTIIVACPFTSLTSSLAQLVRQTLDDFQHGLGQVVHMYTDDIEQNPNWRVLLCCIQSLHKFSFRCGLAGDRRGQRRVQAAGPVELCGSQD